MLAFLLFQQNLFDNLEKKSQSFSLPGVSDTGVHDDLHAATKYKVGHNSSSGPAELNEDDIDSVPSKQLLEKGSKKKRGKSTGNTKTGAAEGSPDNQETIPAKSKKNNRKGKATSSQVSDSKTSVAKDVDKMKEDNFSIFPEKWLIQNIKALVPEFEDQGAKFILFVLPCIFAKHATTYVSNLTNIFL